MKARRGLYGRILLLSSAIALYSCSAAIKTAQAPPSEKLPVPGAFRAKAIITAYNPDPVSANAVIIAKRPGYIRIEVKGPFGQTAAIFISDNENIYAFSGSGAPILGITAQEGRYPFTPSEVYAMLTGSSPTNTEQGFESKTSTDAGGRVTAYAKTFDGHRAFSAEFADYREVSGTEMPFSIKIIIGGQNYSIKYTSIEVDPELPEGAFELPSR